MDIDQKLDKFFLHLYGPLAKAKRVRQLRRELEKFIKIALMEKKYGHPR